MNNNKLALIIGWLYPDLMSTYGDRGNIICLKKRCEWRGINVEVREISLTTEDLTLNACDLLFMGGAQDKQQKIVADDLHGNKGLKLKEMIDNNTPGLFICGAYQFLGKYYKPAEGENIQGLGIFDLFTIHPGIGKERCIGNIIIKIQNSEFGTENFIVGFENHGGRTYLGNKVESLGNVIKGYGNNGDLPASLNGRQVQAGDGTEGYIYKNSIGTYLHGPILPKNPYLADWLIQKALLKKYGNKVELKKLDDALEWQAHDHILKKLKIQK
ncbi:MAG: cobalamin biosynthesis protein CobQ [Candidatus Gottesmanbacteria bacterium]